MNRDEFAEMVRQVITDLLVKFGPACHDINQCTGNQTGH